MFGKKRKLRNDLPVIDLRKKHVKGLFGQTKLITKTKKEQRAIKKILMEQYPDRYYVDDLYEWNSISGRDDLSWIDDIEAYDALLGK